MGEEGRMRRRRRWSGGVSEKQEFPPQRMWGQTEIVNTNLDDVSPSPMRVRDHSISNEIGRYPGL